MSFPLLIDGMIQWGLSLSDGLLECPCDAGIPLIYFKLDILDPLREPAHESTDCVSRKITDFGSQTTTYLIVVRMLPATHEYDRCKSPKAV